MEFDPEKKIEQLQFVEVTAENADLLVELRSKIDREKTSGKLIHEAEKYGKGKERRAFIVLEGTEPIGFVEVELNDDDLPQGAPEIEGLDDLAHIARIAVVEEFRGKGIGKKLLYKAEEWAKENGKQGVWLDYLVENEAAERLYKSAGYKDIAEFLDLAKNKMRRIAAKEF